MYYFDKVRTKRVHSSTKNNKPCFDFAKQYKTYIEAGPKNKEQCRYDMIMTIGMTRTLLHDITIKKNVSKQHFLCLLETWYNGVWGTND